MRIFLYLLLLNCTFHFATAQSLKFNYDECGNRISREFFFPDAELPTLKKSLQRGNIEWSLFTESVSNCTNLTAGTLKIVLNDFNSQTDVDIYVCNTWGQIIYSKTASSETTEFNIENYPKGVYLICIISKDSVKTYKVVNK